MPTNVDDFEDQNLDEYTGDVDDASIVTSPASEGDYSVRVNSGKNEIISTAGLSNYPAQGDTIRVDVQLLDSANETRFGWGVQDADNMYFCQITHTALSLQKRSGGDNTVLDVATDLTVPKEKYLTLEVKWKNDGSMTVILFDNGSKIGSVSEQDQSYGGGGIMVGEDSEAFGDSGVIDNFEDQNMDEYSGDLDATTIQVGTTFDGDYALSINEGENEVISTSGLENYPEQGKKWVVYHYTQSENKPRSGFAVQDADNLVFWEIDTENGTLRLVERVDGVENELATTSNLAIPNGGWVEAAAEWRTNQDVTVQLFDQSSDPPTEITSGGITGTLSQSWTNGGFMLGEWSLPYDLIEDFEDGNADGWGSNVTAVDTTVYQGSYAGEFADTTGSLAYDMADAAWSEISWAWNFNQRSLQDVRLQTPSGTDVIQIAVDDGSQGNSGEVLYNDGSWQSTGIETVYNNEWNLFEITNIDYGNGTFDIEVLDDSQNSLGTSSGNFKNSTSDLGFFYVTLGSKMWMDQITGQD